MAVIRPISRIQEADAGAEMLFIERYDRMLGWSMQLTDRDRDRAEDLLHDLFVQFVLNSPELGEIENLDGYLYISLRNLNTAQQRRANRNRLIQLSLVDYDSAEIGLRAVDFRDQLAAQEELRIICRYACARKENAKIASVLILRFFHGYYPDEIARVSASPRAAVDKWLSLARIEAKASLEKDSKLAFLAQSELPEVQIAEHVQNPADLLTELRASIFRSRQGECFDESSLASLYDPKEELKPVECLQLAHIVSCQACLDGVNEVLGLDLLATRSATDTLSRDPKKRDDDTKFGGGGGTGGSSSGGSMDDGMLMMMRRKVKDTFAHRPQELCVAVNGYALGSHRVSAERSELNLVVERNEPIDFIEVYTDQKIRLLLHNIEEQPPAGPGERGSVVRLSDGRLLELSLRFTSPSPTIQVTYLDPTYAPMEVGAELSAIDSVSPAILNGEVKPPATAGGTDKRRAADSIHTSLLGLDEDGVATEKNWFSRFVENLTSFRFWLQPATVAVMGTLLILATTVWFLRPGEQIITSVPELLKQATAAEQTLAARTDLVVHRTIDVEERNVTSGAVRRQKIDLWHSGERGAEARRLFDEQGRLVAGGFTADGKSTTYSKNDVSGSKSVPPAVAGGDLPSSVWKNALSAKDFGNLVASVDKAQFVDTGERYEVKYRDDSDTGGVVNATLVFNKSDLRPVEQTMTLRRALSVPPAVAGGLTRPTDNAVNQRSSGPNANDELIEYRFIETAFEQRAPNSVAPSVFEPDPELLVPEATVVTREVSEPESETTGSENTNTNSNTAVKPPTAIATADLEVEVLRLLNQASADIDDQTNMTRTADGRLQVTGLVDSKEEKSEILKALSSVANNPALVIRVETYEEAAARQKQTQNAPTSVTRIEVTKGRIAVYEDVARHLGKSANEADADTAVQRFSASVLNRSRLVMSQAGTLKKLSGRFSRDDLKNMTPEARAKWLALLRSHASNCEAENRRLRQDLSALFGIASGGAGEGSELIDTDAELQSAAARLFAEAAANDRVIRSAFTISGEAASASPIKNQAFLRAMSGVERLAASLQRAR